MHQLSFYVPAEHCESVKRAVFTAGAGRIGHYERCCWQVMGQGQFRPLAGADPHTGSVGALETVPEYKVELICDDAAIGAAVAAMKDAHPYEEPAYHVVKLEDF